MKRTSSKYAFVGTSCVGKTTLIHEIQKKIGVEFPKLEVAIVPEAARIYFSKNKTSNPFSFYHQTRIQKLALKMEAEKQKEGKNIILCDRSVVDAVVYLSATHDEIGSRILLQRVNDWIFTYTHFFLLDPEDVPYKKDHIRKEDKYQRDEFHRAFLAYFSSSRLPYSLISGSKRERIGTMKKIIYNTWHVA